MEDLNVQNRGLTGTLDSLTDLLREAAGAFDDLGASAEDTAKSQQKVTKAMSAARRTVKRTLMAFDKINRLTAATGSSSRSSGSKTTKEETPDTLRDRIQAAVEKIMKALQPMLSVDTGPLQEAFRNLWSVLQPVFQNLGDLVAALWRNGLGPFMSWVVETLAPTLVNGLAGAMGTISGALGTAAGAVLRLGEHFQPLVELVGEKASGALSRFGQIFQGLSQTVLEKAPWIQNAFSAIGEKVGLAGQGMAPVFETISGFFRNVSNTATIVASKVNTAFGSIISYLSSTFTGGWYKSWDGIRSALRGVINGIIGLINRMLSALGTGINNVIRAANRVKFTVPAWVPLLGGKTYGFSMSTVSVPTVPYLAQGAVLPANQPFLAVVGDQRHGTNVEAPLSTIQEAVANVLAQNQGQEAVVGKLSQILEAVLGIRLGDREVYEAQDRYRKRMAMIHGGV